MYRLLLFIVFTMWFDFSFGQVVNLREEYEAFKRQTLQEYNDYRSRINKEYADFVRKTWEEYKGIKPTPLPKEDEFGRCGGRSL